MEKDLAKKIEERITELESQGKKMVDFSNGVTANIKKLLAEKAKANDEANVIAGAIQAFKGVLSELSLSESNESCKAIAAEKEENV